MSDPPPRRRPDGHRDAGPRGAGGLAGDPEGEPRDQNLVFKGGLVLDPQVAREALREPEPAPGGGDGDSYEALTDREKQMLRIVAEGKSNKEVAEVLGISVKTAMSDRERVMEKLGLHNRTDLIRFALKKGVIQA